MRESLFNPPQKRSHNCYNRCSWKDKKIINNACRRSESLILGGSVNHWGVQIGFWHPYIKHTCLLIQDLLHRISTYKTYQLKITIRMCTRSLFRPKFGRFEERSPLPSTYRYRDARETFIIRRSCDAPLVYFQKVVPIHHYFYKTLRFAWRANRYT